MPDDEPMVASALSLVHVPPVVASLSDVVKPAHTLVVPRTGDIGLTVTSVVAVHPVDSV